MLTTRWTWLSLLALVLPACSRNQPTESILPEDPKRLTIPLTSPAFLGGGPIPKKYTCEGEEISPPLSWLDTPQSARSLALVCEDLDAPKGTFTHWLLFNIPADLKGLEEGIPPQEQVTLGSGGVAARQGMNDFGKVGFGGPCPPSGSHRYVFRLYALDTRLDPGPGATRLRVLQAMKGHILAEGRLLGKYSR